MSRSLAQAFAARMYYYAEIADVGYSQPNRWSIRALSGQSAPGARAEADCSSMVATAADDVGLPTGGATYTGDMRSALVSAGWGCLPWAATGGDSANLYTGDVLLSEAASGGVGHVAVFVGEDRICEAWIDGTGDIGGSAWGDGPGDSGGETRCVSFYAHPYTQGGVWTHVLRPPEDPTTSASTPEGAGSAPAPTPEIESENTTMHLISTTTPWGTSAYALVHDSIGGARAVDNSDGGELNAYIRMCGEPKWVEWDWYNLLIRRSWEDHNWNLERIMAGVREDINAAVDRVVNATRPEGR